jgi:predicted transglutaminase-like cysteine proteinase
MKTMLLGLTGLGALAALSLAAASASAQVASAPYDWGNRTLAQREDALTSRAHHSWDDGWIDQAQFLGVTNEIAGVQRAEDRLRNEQSGELTSRQMTNLQDRNDRVASQINRMDDEP